MGGEWQMWFNLYLLLKEVVPSWDSNPLPWDSDSREYTHDTSIYVFEIKIVKARRRDWITSSLVGTLSSEQIYSDFSFIYLFVSR